MPLGLTTSFTFTGLPAPTVTPVCFKYLRKYPLWGRFTDSHGNVGPAGSAAPTCQAVVPAVPLYYNQPTAWPGADGSCFINASSAACASCSADSNAGVPFPYVSPLICHATFVGLAPNTVIEYTISGVVDGVAYTTSAKQIRGGLFSLKTPSTPDAPAYPLRWGLLGDPGACDCRMRRGWEKSGGVQGWPRTFGPAPGALGPWPWALGPGLAPHPFGRALR